MRRVVTPSPSAVTRDAWGTGDSARKASLSSVWSAIRASHDPGEQGWGIHPVVTLTRQPYKSHQVAQGVDPHADLGAGTPSRVTDRLQLGEYRSFSKLL